MTNTLDIMQADFNKALANKSNSFSVSKNNTPIETPNKTKLDDIKISRIIEMAWEDRTPFSAVEHNYGLSESDVIELMRREMKPSSFKMWRKRVTNRATKHQSKRSFEFGRAYCKTQYKLR